ncbi:unnamed protein product [Mytilus edulis]|uniref:Uncharacterized protein n=1 Tax=Mytilus edulis TaxID=6550 RepID=A0A8S3V9T3_MYTED|nr:unnamed protein product [Mytilus edulis]
MSEPVLDLNEEDLLRDPLHGQPERLNASNSQANQNRDLVDTFGLFKDYLDKKLVDLKSDILSEQDNLSKKFRDEANIKFKSEGNRIQFRFNENILDGLNKIHKDLVSVASPLSSITGDLSIDEILDRFLFFSARQLAQVTGKIISLSPVLGNLTRLMTRYCYLCIVQRLSWDKLLQIVYPAEILNELKFWKSNVVTLNKKKLAMYSPSSIVIFSDASNVACGAYTVELENKIFHKMWNELERCKSSTWREMRAIEQALLSFSTLFMGKSLKWFTDNQNCVRIVQAGSMKEDLQNLAYSIFCICKEHNILIELQWIPRTLNSKADYISKMSDHEDWQISNEFFEFLESLWGPFTVDRFASVMNNKTKRFNSLFWNPNAEAVDAFTQNWNGENNWLVPPIYSVIRTIKHLIYCKAKGSLIVPRWVSSPFWSYIFNKNLTYKAYVKDVLEFKETNRIYSKGSSPKCIFGTEKFLSTVLAVRLDASL